MKRSGFILSFIILSVISNAQLITPQEYINIYKDIAVAEMKRSGIPASVTLAQGKLETESGNSELVKKSNNHFGIKCKSTWTGETVSHTDDAPDECFRKYKFPADSYKDHSDYLKSAPRYASLFQLQPGDYKGWAYGLKRAGYATNPKYPQILITNIERYNLQQYDTLNSASNVIESSAVITTEKPEVMKVMLVPPEDVPVPTLQIKGNTRFNGLKAYFAPKGTSLLAIATSADLPLVKLLEYNDLPFDGLTKENSWIYLEKKAKQGNRDSYTSIQDESLYSIAQNNGVQLQALSRFNELPENANIKKGTKIKLRSPQQVTMSK